MREVPRLSAGCPVLVTGAGGFVGGHVARALAVAGYRVRGLVRRQPPIAAGDPPIDWRFGDICEPRDCAEAVEGMIGVVHCAGWVSLGSDRSGESHATNVEATRTLLDAAECAGVERFLYTSTLWTVAAGTPEAPAHEGTSWNLARVQSPYCDTKREAERIVLSRDGPKLNTVVLCPGLVIGPRDVRPTSTRLFLQIARTPLAILPQGGIPVIDAHVLAQAHVRALERAESGQRYVVAGSYLSYPEMARLVALVCGRPRWVWTIPDLMERPLAHAAGLVDGVSGGRLADVSAAAVAGGFLRLHVSGARADAALDLSHPPPIESIRRALTDAQQSGRASWLRLL